MEICGVEKIFPKKLKSVDRFFQRKFEGLKKISIVCLIIRTCVMFALPVASKLYTMVWGGEGREGTINRVTVKNL